MCRKRRSASSGAAERDAVEERIRALGGTPGESDAAALVAVFEGPDERSRAIAAVEAALAVLAAEDALDGSTASASR